MSGRLRAALVAVAAVVLALAWLPAASALPTFGGASHPYGDRAVAISNQQQTASAVASVSFDQRGFDTLGEEFILVLAVLGATLLLRRQADETEQAPAGQEEESEQAPRDAPTADAVRLMGYLMLPVTLLVSLYVVAHGHVSPGGGFQGGVALATAIHLLYLAGNYSSLERLRPVTLFEAGESVGATTYAAIGLVGLAGGSAFLANTLPHGSAGSLLSAGTVPLLQGAVGVAVTGGVMVLLSEFLEQTLVVRPRDRT